MKKSLPRQFPLYLKENHAPLIYIVSIGVMIHIFNMGISYILIVSGVDVSSLGGIQDSKHNQNIIILVSILVVPLIETLIGQMLPIHIVARFTSSKTSMVIASMIVFSALHVLNSPLYIVITIPAAYLLAITYLLYMDKKFKAVLITSACHAIANLLSSFWIILESNGV